jgi:hypothetical protein
MGVAEVWFVIAAYKFGHPLPDVRVFVRYGTGRRLPAYGALPPDIFPEREIL